MFVDSAADDNFIDTSLVEKSLVSTETLDTPKTINTLHGRQLVVITHRTLPINLTISKNHRQLIQLYIIPSTLLSSRAGTPRVTFSQPPH